MNSSNINKEVTELNENETDKNNENDFYLFLNTDIENRPKSNLDDCTDENNNIKDYECEYNRVNTIQDISSSKILFKF